MIADEIRRLRREIAASLIAVKPHLDQPYPDDPRWTPWTRFVEKALAQVDDLAKLAVREQEGSWGEPYEAAMIPEGHFIPAGDERCGFVMDACTCMKRKGHEGLHACAHGGWR